MIEFIKLNIGWIKDLMTILFAGTATIITILTYRRAKATILQPIRSEAIKKQSELLSRILQFLKENHQSFEIGIDYQNIVFVNTIKTLKDYGFIFKKQDKLFEKPKDEVTGWLPCGKSNILHDVEIIEVFDTNKEKNNKEDFGKKKYDNLKNGNIDIDKIYLTKTISNFMKTLSDFKNNPFLPISLQKVLVELIDAINTNLTIILKKEIEKFMLDFSREYFDKKIAPHFNPIGIYNNFNHERIHHKKSVIKLRDEIRKYLLIDNPW